MPKIAKSSQTYREKMSSDPDWVKKQQEYERNRPKRDRSNRKRKPRKRTRVDLPTAPRSIQDIESFGEKTMDTMVKTGDHVLSTISDYSKTAIKDTMARSAPAPSENTYDDDSDEDDSSSGSDEEVIIAVRSALVKNLRPPSPLRTENNINRLFSPVGRSPLPHPPSRSGTGDDIKGLFSPIKPPLAPA